MNMVRQQPKKISITQLHREWKYRKTFFEPHCMYKIQDDWNATAKVETI